MSATRKMCPPYIYIAECGGQIRHIKSNGQRQIRDLIAGWPGQLKLF